jgi:hypothetical protein
VQKKKQSNFISYRTVKILCDKHHTHLEILRIDGAQLTDNSLEYIDQCRQLKSLMIEFCTNLTGCHFHIFRVSYFFSSLIHFVFE